MNFVFRHAWRGSLLARCLGPGLAHAFAPALGLGLLACELFVVSCADPDAEEDRQVDGSDASTTNDVTSGDAGIDDASADTDSDAGSACGDAAWCPATAPEQSWLGLTSVWGSGRDDVWIVGASGRANHWDGRAWRTTTTPTSQTLQAVWGTGPNDVWAVSTTDVVLHSTGFANGDAPWTRQTPIATYPVPMIGGFLRAIWGTSPNDIWTGGDVWIMYRPDSFTPESGWRSAPSDGGVAWSPLTSFRNGQIRSIWGTGPDDIWIVGKGPSAAHTNGENGEDGRPKWTEFDTQSLATLSAVWGSASGDVWAVGDYGTIRHFTAGASRWAIVESPTNEHLRGLWGASANDVWAVGERGTILHYDGESWTPSTAAFPSGKKPHLYGVWGSGPTDVWAVGGDTVLRLSDRTPSKEAP